MKKNKFFISAATTLYLLTICSFKFQPFQQKETGPKIWMETGVNQLINGDFSKQNKGWNFYFSGGNASAQYNGKQADISLSSTGNVNYGVQFYYDGFRLYQGGEYTLNFTAGATTPKGCEVRIQLNGGDYHAYVINTYTLTPNVRTYSMNFKM
ncbi:MAG: carbohydrate binding domain-containing protein, partial [Treponema sp.]|nr:carbohydrate binding domain-containing protein [Treponema sp.]